MLRCWRDLDSCRPPVTYSVPAPRGGAYSMTMFGAIPFVAIVQWAQLEQCDQQLTKLLVRAITTLDAHRAESESSKLALKGGRS